MKKILLLNFLILLVSSSCSSHKLSTAMWKGAGAGATGGALLDIAIKPEKQEYRVENTVGSALIGGVLGAGVAWLMHKEDPTKNPQRRKTDEEIREEFKNLNKPDFDYNLGGKQFNFNIEFKKAKSFSQKTKNVPKDLQHLFPDPTIEEHILEPQVKTVGNQTMVIKECKLYMQNVPNANVEGK